MEYQERFQGKNELRMRFTVWLKIVVKRAKIDYIRRLKRRCLEVSIEEAGVIDTLMYEQKFEIVNEGTGFDSENGQMAAAFAKLSPKRSQILVMLFVRNLTSEEIAEELNCSLQYVYNQRSMALKELRRHLNKEE